MQEQKEMTEEENTMLVETDKGDLEDGTQKKVTVYLGRYIRYAEAPRYRHYEDADVQAMNALCKLTFALEARLTNDLSYGAKDEKTIEFLCLETTAETVLGRQIMEDFNFQQDYIWSVLLTMDTTGIYVRTLFIPRGIAILRRLLYKGLTREKLQAQRVQEAIRAENTAFFELSKPFLERNQLEWQEESAVTMLNDATSIVKIMRKDDVKTEIIRVNLDDFDAQLQLEGFLAAVAETMQGDVAEIMYEIWELTTPLAVFLGITAWRPMVQFKKFFSYQANFMVQGEGLTGGMREKTLRGNLQEFSDVWFGTMNLALRSLRESID